MLMSKLNNIMAEFGTAFDPDKFTECLTKQISELELFQAMYTPKEIIITNTQVLDSIRNFIEKNINIAPNHLDYTIIHSSENIKFEISVHLPSCYPDVPPEVHVRCNQLNRQQETSLNVDLMAYLESKHDGEVCIFTAILWVQDNIENYIKTQTKKVACDANPKPLQNFSRYWIYSHHIYSKKKTEEMSKLSKELQVTGFCLLGKPAVICVEGNEEDCKSWWKIVKSMHWQKIALRITEHFKPYRTAKEKKFDKFEILSFPTPMSNGHSDLGSFQQYMEKCGLLNQVTQFFGAHSS